MTDEAKKIMEDAQTLREIMLDDCIDFPHVVHTMCHKAADLIESLGAELEQVKQERDEAWKVVESVSKQNELMGGALEHIKRERDAAITDMKDIADNYVVCMHCEKRQDESGACDRWHDQIGCWEWRGVKEG